MHNGEGLTFYMDDQLSHRLQLNINRGGLDRPILPLTKLFTPGKVAIQTLFYNSLRCSTWFEGSPITAFNKRSQRTWGPAFTWELYSQQIHIIRAQPYRLRWIYWAAWLNEWPTFRKLRHAWGPGLPCPPCRFCCQGPDCITHYFTNCSGLRHYVAREFDRDDMTLTLVQPDLSRFTKLLQIYYTVYAALRWRATSGFTRVLREGKWVGRFVSSALLASQAAEQSARRLLTNQTRARRRAEKLHQTQTCPCGQPLPRQLPWALCLTCRLQHVGPVAHRV